MSESTTTTAASTLTAPDIEKASQVRLLFEQARSHKKNRYEIWNRSYRMLHNRGWSNLRQQWMPSPLASEIYPIVASMVGWMTDNDGLRSRNAAVYFPRLRVPDPLNGVTKAPWLRKPRAERWRSWMC